MQVGGGGKNWLKIYKLTLFLIKVLCLKINIYHMVCVAVLVNILVTTIAKELSDFCSILLQASGKVMLSVCYMVTISCLNFHLWQFLKDVITRTMNAFDCFLLAVIKCTCVTTAETSRQLVSTFSVMVSIGLTSTAL